MRTMEFWLRPETWIALTTLTAMEIVLGIDNIVFISILSGKLPPALQLRAQRLGLGLALILRLGLLATISWIMGLSKPLFTLLEHDMSGRDLILLIGGLFLVAKATQEIYDKLEGAHPAEKTARGRGAFGFTIIQILALDIVFSLDSVITAVGMASDIVIMVIAMVLAVGIMLWWATRISRFSWSQV